MFSFYASNLHYPKNEILLRGYRVKNIQVTDIQSHTLGCHISLPFDRSCCVMGFFLSIENSEWTVGGLISKDNDRYPKLNVGAISPNSLIFV